MHYSYGLNILELSLFDLGFGILTFYFLLYIIKFSQILSSCISSDTSSYIYMSYILSFHRY